MARRFSEFTSGVNPAAADEVVGIRPGDPAAVANRRWTWGAVRAWLESTFSLWLLDRGQDNVIWARGAASGNAVEISAQGVDANIALALSGKGTGAVITVGELSSNGNTLYTGGGHFLMDGGLLDTEGGNIQTSNGNMLLGSGDLTTTGDVAAGNATLSGTLTAPTAALTTVSVGGVATFTNTINAAVLNTSGLVTMNNGAVIHDGLGVTGGTFINDLLAVTGDVIIEGNVAHRAMRGEIRVVIAGTTLGANDYTLLCDGTFTVDLTVSVALEPGRIVVIKNAGIGTVTVAAFGAELIDGLATQDILAGDSMTIQNTGSGWIII